MKKKLLYSLVIFFILIFFIPLGSLYAQPGTNLSIKEVNYEDYPQVDIYFSLYDSSGLPVENVTTTDIELKENSNPVDDFSIEQIVNTTTPSYIALLIDNSGSMKGDPLEEAKEAAKEFIDSINDIDEIKIFVFNNAPEVIQDFTTDKTQAKNAIKAIEEEGDKTTLNLAVYNAAKDLEAKPAGQRVIVVLTDGKDEGASIAIEDAIDKAKENRIPIFSVGFGSKFDEDSAKYEEDSSEALSRFSILTGGVFLVAAEEGELAASLGKVSDLLKYQYHLQYSSDLPKDGKAYSIELAVSVLDETLLDTSEIVTPTFEVTASLGDIEDGIELEDKITITPEITVTDPFSPKDEIKKVEYFMDDDSIPIAESDAYPFSTELDPADFEYGTHTLIVKIYDSLDRIVELDAEVVFPAPKSYLNIIIYSLVGALVLILAIVLPIVLVKRKRRKDKEVDVIPIGEEEDMEGKEDTFPGEGIGPDTIPEGPGTGSDTISEGEEPKLGPGTIILDRSKVGPVSAAWLAVIKGEGMGKEYSIPLESKPKARRVTIGRDTANDIVLDDSTVSGEHAFIKIDKDKYTIGDALSTNGTILNGKKITSHRKLSDGDRIILGDTELEFKVVKLGRSEAKKAPRKAKKSSRKEKK